MVSRARNRATSPAAESAGAKVVYYSPFGGRVIGVLDARDEKYERELDRTGTAWERAEGMAAPPEGADLSHYFVVKGEQEALEVEFRA